MHRTELLTSITLGAGADNPLALTAVELPIAVPHSRPQRQKKLDSIRRDADDVRAVSADYPYLPKARSRQRARAFVLPPRHPGM